MTAAELKCPTPAFRFVLIAYTGELFADFTPYVPSLNDRGVVAFQAALASGGTGIFTADGCRIMKLLDSASSDFTSFDSHPDIASWGAVSFYATLKSGGAGVFFHHAGETKPVALAGETLGRIGPLGPTMNARATVAFRADCASGNAGLWVGTPDIQAAIGREARSFAAEVVAQACSLGDPHRHDAYATRQAASEVFSGFQGLPVINRAGSVAFRADRRCGGHGIYVWRSGTVEVIADTGARFSELGRFPIINDDEMVAFTARLASGGQGIFGVKAGQVTTLAESGNGYASFRGVLINRRGFVACYATPPDGSLGIYVGPDPQADRVLSCGDALLGGTVTDFALNPVSVNEAGQFTLRVALSTGRQAIIRADPAG